MMKLQIFLLRFMAIAFDLFGIVYFFLPAQTAGTLGIQLTQPSAFGDVRATYGGLAFGIAIFLWMCATPAHVRLGLRLVLLMGLGLMLCRLLSMVIDGAPNTAALFFLGLEVFMVVSSALALRAKSETDVDRAQLQTT
jgi:hypothetical protein